MWHLLGPILLLTLCLVMLIRGIRLHKVDIPLLPFDMTWEVKRKDLPFFYWLGITLWLLGILASLFWLSLKLN